MLRLAMVLGLAGCAGFAHATGEQPSTAPEIARGEAAYQRCIGCHSLERNRTGPLHCGVVGRSAAAVRGFEYSHALRRSGIVWTPDALDEFLAAPLTVVPGTTMGFAGIVDAEERRSIIEYLEYASKELCDGSGN